MLQSVIEFINHRMMVTNGQLCFPFHSDREDACSCIILGCKADLTKPRHSSFAVPMDLIHRYAAEYDAHLCLIVFEFTIFLIER
jgi:hypothetical protein